MKQIPKYTFAEAIGMSMSKLRAYTRKYRCELSRLKQSGNCFNYKAVLFLCWKIVVDPLEVYPDEEKQLLQKEQSQVLTYLYGDNKSNW